MTTARSAAQHPTARPRALLSSSVLIATALAGLTCAVLGYVFDNAPGLYGAAIGGLLAIGFMAGGFAVLGLFSAAKPGFLMVIALLTYGLQVVALLAVYAAFSNSPSWTTAVSTAALGATVIVCSLVWTVGLLLAARRTRTLLYDVGGDGR